LSFITEHKKELIIAGVTICGVLATFYVLNKFVFNHKIRLKHNANKDLKLWNGKRETDPSMSDTLVKYWKQVGLSVLPKQVQTSSFNSSYPWSSAYIGYLVNHSGFKNFKAHSTLSAYVIDAKNNRKNKLNHSYWAYKPSELEKVEVGDILVKGRSGSKPNIDTLNSGVLTHGDIVVSIKNINGQKFAITQGGNLSDTVSRTKVALTENERLLNPVHFAQLKYKN